MLRCFSVAESVSTYDWMNAQNVSRLIEIWRAFEEKETVNVLATRQPQ